MTSDGVEKVKYDGVGRDRGNGGYEVLLGGRVIGTVEPYEKRYNLRRMIVDRGWIVYAGGQQVSSDSTRRGAVRDLLRHLGLDPEAAR